MTSPSSKTAVRPRPLFVYGTLRAMPLLALVITGDPQNTDMVRKLARKAVVKGYARYAVRGEDYPAVIKSDASSHVDGLILFLQTRSQRSKLDEFEGEMYKVTPVSVGMIDGPDEKEVQVDADIYVWSGDRDDVSSYPWDLDTFIRERLDDWLDSFVGLELVGDDDSQLFHLDFPIKNSTLLDDLLIFVIQ